MWILLKIQYLYWHSYGHPIVIVQDFVHVDYIWEKNKVNIILKSCIFYLTKHPYTIGYFYNRYVNNTHCSIYIHNWICCAATFGFISQTIFINEKSIFRNTYNFKNQVPIMEKHILFTLGIMEKVGFLAKKSWNSWKN